MKEEKNTCVIINNNNNLILNELTSDEAFQLAEPKKKKKMRETIVKNNKSTGIDGFTEDYYKVQNISISLLLYCASYTTVLDPRQCAGYCSSILLCLDYKILTSKLAIRIQKMYSEINKIRSNRVYLRLPRDKQC